MKEPNQEDFNYYLAIPVNRRFASKSLWLLLGLIAANVFFMPSLYRGTYSLVAVFVLAGLIVSLVGLCMLTAHLLALILNPEDVVTLDVTGLYDKASFLNLGHIPLSEIKTLKVVRSSLGPLLQIRLQPHSRAFYRYSGLKGALLENYDLFFPQYIWIPVPLLDIARYELEAKLLKFSRWQKQQMVSALRSALTPSSEPTVIRRHTGIFTLLGLKEERAEVEAEFAAAVREREKSEKTRILEQIESIRKYVRDTGLDRVVCELYADEIANFVRWFEAADERLPVCVTDVERVAESSAYDETAFSYAGHRFHLGLQRNVGSSTEALLNLGFDGRINMSLKVQVEIGTLEPLQVEKFIEGPWEQTLRSLARDIQTQRRQERTKRMKMGEETLLAEAQASENSDDLDQLKKRFGLD